MIESMASKLQLPDLVVSKAMEYQRLVSVKCSTLLKQYSDSCISVICLQLASQSMGVQFDKVYPWVIAVMLGKLSLDYSSEAIWCEKNSVW